MGTSGLMWALALVCLAGNLLNALKLRVCFVIWIGCNIVWLAIDVTAASYGRAFLDGAQIAFCVLGLQKWKR